MRLWHRRLINFIRKFDRTLYTVRGGYRRAIRREWRRPPWIDAYYGYGAPDFVRISGRVLRDKRITANPTDSSYRNMVNMIKRFDSDELKQAELEIRIGENQFKVTTNSEGYYHLDTQLPKPVQANEEQYTRCTIELLSVPRFGPINLKTRSRIFIPPTEPAFGLISDVDDTLIQSHLSAPFKLKAIATTLFQNPSTRQTVEDAPAFYRFFASHQTEQPRAIFYVSNSPWNLFDFLKEFLKLHKYPLGPLLLRDLGTPNQRIFTREPHHKTAVIRKILQTYPQLKFLLIGDSGERDPHIYSQIREEFPDRILGTYIREIKGGKWQKNDKQQHIFSFQHFREAQQQLQNEDWFLEFSQKGK